MFIAVPSRDLSLFKNKIGIERCELISDEDIFQVSHQAILKNYESFSPNIMQQVIKAEFWRLVDYEAYLCIDSDSQFVRNFYYTDFVAEDGNPYTIMHQCKEFLQFSVNTGKKKVVEYFYRDSARGKSLFGRLGPDYDFGPTPVVWSAKVWRDLAENFLEPREWTFTDAIHHFPAELRWYGEALLAYRSITLHPIEPLFRVYHTYGQHKYLAKQGENLGKVGRLYFGAVYQSNWDFQMDFEGDKRSQISKLSRWLRKKFE